ncbi:MAG TPA: alpha/beta hydrolase [Caulobacteraceae bacterium]
MQTLSHVVIGMAAAAALLAGAAPAAAAPPPATAASTRLFADSQLVVGDRFSDEVIGNGPDLIFVPGLASSRETWRVTAQRLRGRFRLHLIQIAGFAGEPARANAAGPVLAPSAEALDAYIVAHHLAPAVLIGHSLGGTIALYLAEHHPEHLKKVLIVDALPFFAVTMMGPAATAANVSPMAESLRAGPAMAPDAQSKMIAGMVTGPADRDRVTGWSRASNYSVVAAALADDLELDLRAGLAATSTPITVLYPDNLAVGMPAGAADRFYGAAFAHLPNKTLKRVDHSLHFIMLDQPEVFAADLDEFLAH